MASTNGIPEDIVYQISELSCNITPGGTELKDVFKDTRYEDISERVFKKYKDPTEYLSQITHDPKGLLHTMFMTRTILSGSRAAAYFYKDICTDESDWDFYCDPYPPRVALFLDYLQELGYSTPISINSVIRVHHSERHVVGLPRQADEFITTEDRMDTYPNDNITIFNLHKRDHKTQKNINIQVIVPPMNVSTYDLIIKFHSSIIQCFINGVAAVSMYYDESVKKRSLRWLTQVHNSMRSSMNKNQRCIDKYRNRGITYITYDKYMAQSNNIATNIEQERSLTDGNSLVIPFDHLAIGFEDKELFDISITLLKNIKWLERPYTLIPNTNIHTGYIRCCPTNKFRFIRRLNLPIEAQTYVTGIPVECYYNVDANAFALPPYMSNIANLVDIDRSINYAYNIPLKWVESNGNTFTRAFHVP